MRGRRGRDEGKKEGREGKEEGDVGVKGKTREDGGGRQEI